jgi:hypothetical protein
MANVLSRGTNKDGSKRYMSFYVNTNAWNDEDLVDAVLYAYELGHSIGNHTHSHIRCVTEKKDNDFTQRMTADAIYDNIMLAEKAMIEAGIPKEHQFGFRTPFLAYGNETFTAIKKAGFLYDCSIESGWDTKPGTFSWPYTLDVIEGEQEIDAHGKLAWDNSSARKYWGRLVGTGENRHMPNYVGEHPGLWVLIATGVEIDPEDRADAIKASWMGANAWTASGLDYNLWARDAGFALNAGQTTRALMHTVKASLEGNRAPFAFGAHSQYYFTQSGIPLAPMSLEARRASFQNFVEQASQLDDVFFVSSDMVIRWMENPVPASQFNPEDYHRGGPNKPYDQTKDDYDYTNSVSINKTVNKATSTASFAGIQNNQINLNLQAGNYTVELYNLQGRMISRTNINAINGVNATGLKVNNLSKGILILNVKQNGVSVLQHKISVK